MNTQSLNVGISQMNNFYVYLIHLKQTLHLSYKQQTKQSIIQSLIDYHHQYHDNHVSNTNKNLFKQQKQNEITEGFISRKLLLKWINEYDEKEGKSGRKSQKIVLKEGFSEEELGQVFPFQKISLSVLLATCLRGAPSQGKDLMTTSNVADLPSQKSLPSINNLTHSPLSSSQPTLFPPCTIIQILTTHLNINALRRTLLPLIQSYIPMSDKNLTQEQLKDYLLLMGNSTINNINPRHVILAINGHGGSGERVEFQMYKNEGSGHQKGEEKHLEENQERDHNGFGKMQEIMQRLNKRVDNFGKQWLINSNHLQSYSHHLGNTNNNSNNSKR